MATSGHLEALGDAFNNQTGQEVALADDLEVVALYFSAHWCGPCRAFTPALADYYRRLKAAGKRLEIVFVSMDSNDTQYRDYRATMPWLALPFEGDRRKAVTSRFRVMGIPKLILLDAKTGDVITTDGRGAVSSDPDGEQFPYHDWKGGGGMCTLL